MKLTWWAFQRFAGCSRCAHCGAPAPGHGSLPPSSWRPVLKWIRLDLPPKLLSVKPGVLSTLLRMSSVDEVREKWQPMTSHSKLTTEKENSASSNQILFVFGLVWINSKRAAIILWRNRKIKKMTFGCGGTGDDDNLEEKGMGTRNLFAALEGSQRFSTTFARPFAFLRFSYISRRTWAVTNKAKNKKVSRNEWEIGFRFNNTLIYLFFLNKKDPMEWRVLPPIHAVRPSTAESVPN